MPDLPQLSTEGNSRRNFLKAAVVASAAVATAGGAAGYALSSGRAPAPLIRFIGDVHSGDPCDACIEDTGYSVRTYLTTNTPASGSQLTSLGVGFTVNSAGAAQGDFEIFFVDHAPAAATGSGKINLTVLVSGTARNSTDTGDYTETITDIDSSQLFQYSGAGSAVLVTEQTSIPSAPCMDKQSTTLGTFVKKLGQGSSLSDVGMGTAGGINYSPVTSTDDVLVQFHMTWNHPRLISDTTGATQVYTFQFSWTDTGANGHSCTKYLYIKGQQGQ
jgi:hypothetical protein